MKAGFFYVILINKIIIKNMNRIIQSNFKEHQYVFEKIQKLEGAIGDVANLMIKALKEKKTIYWCGNGGSASDSQHLAGELIGRFKGNRRPLKSISLNADSAVITCIANDYGYEHTLSRQVDALGIEGDVLVGISTSGSSNNVNNALRTGNERKMHTVGLLGKGGGDAFNLVSYSILIPSQSTARIQEMHITIGHILCDLIEEGLNLN